MKLSVIIVNYNVEHFLEQCLNSVKAAAKQVSTEVIVVDNNSVDGSLQMMANKFPDITLIANKDNRGFSKANNQGMRIAKGEYVLLLNPDTVVEADTFKKVVDFMDAHPDAGGLGVKMVDGKGVFLPESKRGLPTPAASFYKMFGVSRLFPKSKRFSSYHQGHLSMKETNEIEILSGAFMLMRKEALDKAGLLDEDFFMYGEDIDLSYRILKAGYKNYYFPHTTIIHYKGESTKKDSVNYVVVFYKAMIIFAKKHFSQKNARMFSFLIHMAIVFRAFIALVQQFIRNAFVPLLDFVVTYIGMLGFALYWGQNVVSHPHGFPSEFLYVLMPVYVLMMLVSVYYSGGYDRPVKLLKVLQGLLIGIVAILVVYALLPEELRYSRATILFGAAWSVFILVAYRSVFHMLGFAGFRMGSEVEKRLGIVGDEDEIARVTEIISKTRLNIGFIGKISPDEQNRNDEQIGALNRLADLMEIYKLNEIIFCAKNVSSEDIITQMTNLPSRQLEFKIAPPESLYIIGSNSINSSRDIYMIDLSTISKPANKRFKRLLDLVVSLMILPLLPILVFVVKKPIQLLRNLILVVANQNSWVGFDRVQTRSEVKFPMIKRGVLSPSILLSKENKTTDNIEKVNILYARQYKVFNDINILARGVNNLDRKPR